MDRHAWIFLTITEAFPVFYSHVSYDPKTYRGPFYAPGAKFCQGLDTPRIRQFAKTKCECLVKAGFTVDVVTEII